MSGFSPTKTDKRITKSVVSSHGAAQGALRVAKSIIPDEAVEPLRRLHSGARDYHYKHTLPWGDNHERLLASVHYLEYVTKMRSFSEEADRLADAFVREYPRYIETARTQLGTAFDERDYPRQEFIRDRFGFRMDFKPLPDGGDFRITVAREEMAELRKSINAQVEEASEKARQDLGKRISEPLAAMVNRLSDADAVFRDSLVGNLREICDLIPALNMTGDADLEAVRQRILGELYHTNPEDLREYPSTRTRTAHKAQSILNQLSDCFGQSLAFVA